MVDTWRGLPVDIMTDSRDGARRLAVDNEPTGFNVGRQFRTFKELSVGAGGAYVLRMVFPSNAIIWRAPIVVDAGGVRLTFSMGGSPSGSFSEVLPLVAQNAMTSVPGPAPVAQAVLTAGGTVSGGVSLDVVRLRASVQALVTPASVRHAMEGPIGLSAGTYFLKFDSIGTDTLTGAFGLLWEER